MNKNSVAISNSNTFNSDQRFLTFSNPCIIKSTKSIEYEQFALGRVLPLWNSNDESFFSSYFVLSQLRFLDFVIGF